MSMLAIVVALSCVFFAAVALGANNTSNIFGGPVKAGLISFSWAVMLAFVFEVAGAFVFGGNVERTFAYEILGFSGMRLYDATAIFFLVAFFVFGASLFSMPVSFKQVLVGVMLGYGAVAASSFNAGVVSEIVSSWVVSPLLGIFVGFSAYYFLRGRVARRVKGIGDVDMSFRVFSVLEVLSAVALAFAQGANSISAITGVFSGIGGMVFGDYFTLLLKVLCGAGIALGVLVFGRQMIGAVFGQFFDVNPVMCFAVQFAAFMVVVLFTIFGMPVSSMHVLIGALIGAGLVSGVSSVRWRAVAEIALSWVAVVPLAFAVSYILMYILAVFM